MVRISHSIVTAILLAAVSSFAAEPRVELEVAIERGFAATDAGAWSELLTKAGFSSVRIRSGQGGEEPSLEKRSGAALHVVGILTANNQLVLPQGRFGLRDRAGIEQWLAKLRLDGEEGISIKPGAFGLLPRHLASVHEALATPVKIFTAGKPPRDVAKSIADGLSLKFVTDPAGQQALATKEAVADELRGLSSGTALAAVLRPLGQALVPERAGTELRLRIADSRSVKEHWPVGWPPPGNPRETLPDLFKFLTVEITQTPASEAVTAIGERLKAPVLIDHNSLARYEVDLNSKVNLPSAKTFYAAVLDRTLFQAKLKYELRVDEANKPFLWVTTLRQ